MQNIEYAVISAAGLGSRLGLNIPKCLVEINGRQIIDYQLELLKDVPNIRIVVGFMEQEVIESVNKIRDDILFVRNPLYNSTTNCRSLWLGSRDIPTDYLAIDGDLLIPRTSFANFRENTRKNETLVGITKAKTEDAVFADYKKKTGDILSFSRDINYGYEWTGLVYLSGIRIEKDSKYVFNILEQSLPLKAFEIECYEVDTAFDLDKTRREFVDK